MIGHTGGSQTEPSSDMLESKVSGATQLGPIDNCTHLDDTDFGTLNTSNQLTKKMITRDGTEIYHNNSNIRRQQLSDQIHQTLLAQNHTTTPHHHTTTPQSNTLSGSSTPPHLAQQPAASSCSTTESDRTAEIARWRTGQCGLPPPATLRIQNPSHQNDDRETFENAKTNRELHNVASERFRPKGRKSHPGCLSPGLSNQPESPPSVDDSYLERVESTGVETTLDVVSTPQKDPPACPDQGDTTPPEPPAKKGKTNNLQHNENNGSDSSGPRHPNLESDIITTEAILQTDTPGNDLTHMHHHTCTVDTSLPPHTTIHKMPWIPATELIDENTYPSSLPAQLGPNRSHEATDTDS